jgi:hypothetical protein
MKDTRGRGGEAGRRHCPGGWRLARAAATVAGILVLGTLGLKSGDAQGNAAVAFRQMQAQIASLTQLARQQQEMIQRLNTERRTDAQRLQRLQTAVNVAAGAGDPTAVAIRSSSPEQVLTKLTTRFNTQARQRRAAAPESSEVPLPDLAGARLSGSVLQGAKLVKANLAGATLTGVELMNSSLQGADLRGAKLQGADLTGADLKDVQLTGALYDARTRWPSGFDPSRHGALLVQ